MKYKNIYIIILVFIISCNKYDGPYYETIENYYFNKIGNEQKTFANNYFTNSIGINIQQITGENSINDLRAKFSVISGGGCVDNENVDFINNIASTKWKSGNSTCKQQVKVDITNKKNEILANIIIDGFAFRENVWDTVTIAPDNAVHDLLADTIANNTFIIANGQLYKQGINYFDWVYQNPGLNSPFSLDIDKNGTIYLCNWQGEIFKSINNGNSWTSCSKPITEHPYFYYMTVTADGYIWASTPEYEYSLRYSKDEGQTWINNTAGLDANELICDIFRLSNGNILLYSLNTNLYKSIDDGESWEAIETPPTSTRIYVTNKDEIIAFNQENGATIFKSTDLGQTFKKVYNVNKGYMPSSGQVIQKINNNYYILLSHFGILKTTDFENFEVFWDNPNVFNLYRNHEGVLIVREFGSDLVYYHNGNH